MFPGKDSMLTTHQCNRTFTDENTGRMVRQLTDFPGAANNGYFRFSRYLPDGRMLAWYRDEEWRAMLMDPNSGSIQLRPDIPTLLRLRERDGRAWFLRGGKPGGLESHLPVERLAVWQADLPDGIAQRLCELPEDLPGTVVDITCDGESLIVVDNRQDMEPFKGKSLGDPEVLDRYLRRPRSGTMYCYAPGTGTCRKVHHLDGMCFMHVDTSPVDPGLIRFAQDMTETHGQRIWTVRRDGGDLHPIRPQAFGEVVTHEFWWSDPNLIGYTYQDRRDDPTIEFQHCAEYARVPTRFGLANLAGQEIFLSDPLNSYHTHILVSRDGRLLSGEGTDGNSFVFAAPFDPGNPKVDFVPLATIHTPYIPFRGQHVECAFSSDGQWLIYGDQRPPGKHIQLFAVKVE
jgi:hypothetical protein